MNHLNRLTRLSRSVAGTVAIVTGAASGMGRATALLLADEGAAVGLVDRNAEGLAEVVDTIRSAGARVHGVCADVGEALGPLDAVRQLREALGPVDSLVNNAGISLPFGIESEGFEDAWAKGLAINLTAQVRLIRACLPDLRRRGAGRIVNIASTEGLGATAGMPAYTASKHGVVGLTRSLAVELGPSGVTVNCICPGPINTAMTERHPQADRSKFAHRRTALRRYGEPEEVAHITVSLLMPAASFITGAVIPVDGGLMARNA